MTKSHDRMKQFSENLTDGFEHEKLHLLHHEDNGPEIVMFMMDAEFDPVRVTYDCDGGVSIHSDGHSYHTFTKGQLDLIGSKITQAKEMWDEYFAENPTN